MSSSHWLCPAWSIFCCLHPSCIFSSQRNTGSFHQRIWLRRGSKRVIILFVVTLGITVWSNVALELPPAAGMMAGLGLLQFFCFYLTKTAQEVKSDFAHVYELFGVEAPR